MSNFPPGVAPSSRSWLGIAREIGGGGSSGQGQPVLPTATIPLDKSSYEVEDMPHYLEDLAIRGSMSQRFADVLGVDDASFSFGGPVFGDVWPYFFDNLFGDLSSTGSSPANGTQITNSGGVAVGGVQSADAVIAEARKAIPIMATREKVEYLFCLDFIKFIKLFFCFVYILLFYI